MNTLPKWYKKQFLIVSTRATVTRATGYRTTGETVSGLLSCLNTGKDKGKSRDETKIIFILNSSTLNVPCKWTIQHSTSTLLSPPLETIPSWVARGSGSQPTPPRLAQNHLQFDKGCYMQMKTHHVPSWDPCHCHLRHSLYCVTPHCGPQHFTQCQSA